MIPYIIAATAIIAVLCIVAWVLCKKRKNTKHSHNGTVKQYGILEDEALQGNWESENGRWRARINGHHIRLSLDGEVLFDKGFTGRFVSGRAKAELSLGVKWLRRGDASALRLKALYREGDKLFITTIDPDKRRLAFDDMKETVVLNQKGV